jgi:D-arabinose 1-dehydrogenase-like Zn-dependent alcohol dehydrogenase
MQNTQEANHPIYARENELSKADGVAYVLTDPKGKLVQYPFKFPQLETHDVRAKITFTGLCASDHHHGRGKWAGQ